VKIRNVKSNNRKREFSVVTYSGAEYFYPYSKADPTPSAGNRVEEVFVDKEIGKEAFTYGLESGDEGTVHIEQLLEYHEDPQYLADLLIYKLSVEAQIRVKDSELSRRQIAKQLKTSVPQLYRLLDPSNTNKSMSQLVALLHILNCDVDLVVKKRTVA
jgi:hypothetical protein